MSTSSGTGVDLDLEERSKVTTAQPSAGSSPRKGVMRSVNDPDHLQTGGESGPVDTVELLPVGPSASANQFQNLMTAPEAQSGSPDPIARTPLLGTETEGSPKKIAERNSFRGSVDMELSGQGSPNHPGDALMVDFSGSTLMLSPNSTTTSNRQQATVSPSGVEVQENLSSRRSSLHRDRDGERPAAALEEKEMVVAETPEKKRDPSATGASNQSTNSSICVPWESDQASTVADKRQPSPAFALPPSTPPPSATALLTAPSPSTAATTRLMRPLPTAGSPATLTAPLMSPNELDQYRTPPATFCSTPPFVVAPEDDRGRRDSSGNPTAVVASATLNVAPAPATPPASQVAGNPDAAGALPGTGEPSSTKQATDLPVDDMGSHTPFAAVEKPKPDFTPGDGDECPICLEHFTNDNPASPNPCGHYFHVACQLEWGQRSNACPLCLTVAPGLEPTAFPDIDSDEEEHQQQNAPPDPEEAFRQHLLALFMASYDHDNQEHRMFQMEQERMVGGRRSAQPRLGPRPVTFMLQRAGAAAPLNPPAPARIVPLDEDDDEDPRDERRSVEGPGPVGRGPPRPEIRDDDDFSDSSSEPRTEADAESSADSHTQLPSPSRGRGARGGARNPPARHPRSRSGSRTRATQLVRHRSPTPPPDPNTRKSFWQRFCCCCSSKK